MKKLFLIVLCASITFCINAQIKTPAPSPKCMMTQTVGLTDISLEYSRPSMKGRTIFSNSGLVPYGKMWRTGANQATKITFSDDVMVEGTKVPKGSYAITTIPTATSWTVNFYKHDTGSWSAYTDRTPDASVKVSPQTANHEVQSYTMNIDNITDTGAVLSMNWANTMVPVNIAVEVDDRVMANIDQVLSGPSAGDYYNAATYYHTSGKDLATALQYIQKATKVDKPKFWQVRREALILADMGKFAEAVKVADHSMQLAKVAKNDDYIRMNEKSIAAWTKKILK